MNHEATHLSVPFTKTLLLDVWRDMHLFIDLGALYSDQSFLIVFLSSTMQMLW
jgi:hypothetical protein